MLLSLKTKLPLTYKLLRAEARVLRLVNTDLTTLWKAINMEDCRIPKRYTLIDRLKLKGCPRSQDYIKGAGPSIHTNEYGGALQIRTSIGQYARILYYTGFLFHLNRATYQLELSRLMWNTLN